jgi:hypothetical protein
MILVGLDSVAIRWVRQETLPGATFKRKQNRRRYVRIDLRKIYVTPSFTKHLINYCINK